MKAYDLQCEFMVNPIGIDVSSPLLSWKLSSENRNSRQTAYQLCIYEETDMVHAIMDSGRVNSDACSAEVAGIELKSARRYFWKVRVWDEFDCSSDWSSISFFEMGLLHEEDWDDAFWIEPEQKEEPIITQSRIEHVMYPELHDEDRFVPSLLIQKSFCVSGAVRRARAYITAHGIYEFSLNGAKVGNYELAPEVTAYDKYLQYQTYDITHAMNQGDHTAVLHLAPGWWAGIIGLRSSSCQYGRTMAAIMKIVLEYDDGQKQIVCTDHQTTAATGPYRYAEMYVGEYYDSNLSLEGGKPLPVRIADYGKRNLRGQNAPHIRVVKSISCKRQFVSPKAETILDFGEVLAGKAKLVFKGKKNAMVKLHYFQQLDENGNYFLGVTEDYNQMTDTYLFHSDAVETYVPSFVYRGFRYIWVDGDVQIDLEQTKALLMSSIEGTAGTFECSDDRVTKLAANIQRTATANYMAVPTDNPDRERAGWTGDGQMFFEAGSYAVDTRVFWRRWLEEMRLEQEPNGNIPMIIPYWKSYRGMHPEQYPNSSAWGDACIIIPWMYYCQYGDIRVLKENYGMMQRWMKLVQDTAENCNPEDIQNVTPEKKEDLKYLWNVGFHFGDWLTPSDCTDENGNFQYSPKSLPLRTFTPNCYYSFTTELMRKISAILGNAAESERYARLNARIRDAAFRELFDGSGVPHEDRQGALVLGVQFKLIPETLRDRALQRLLKKIDENGGRMDTGFTSTQYLLDTLTEYGYVKEAYDRLFCTEPPSWLYEVECGATSVWESWQAIMPNGTVNPVSFIQYANGVVGAWLYKTVAGIRPEEAGYKKIRISPELDERLQFVNASYETPFGRVSSAWRRNGAVMTVDVTIPVNTEAVVELPDAVLDEVCEGGEQISSLREFRMAKQTGKKVSVNCGSGKYVFTYVLH